MEFIEIQLAENLERALKDVPEIGDSAFEVAEKIAEIAAATAPIGLTADYANGIKAQRFKGGARVIATDYKSSWIEFGVPSRNQPAHWILRNAAEDAGLTFGKER